MRVISGTAKGHRLVSPKDSSVRPTADRVKEALFSILVSLCGTLDEMDVLDLFAGSGALGIEALSRGAATCTFVDSSRDSIDLIQKNLAATKLSAKAVVLCKNFVSALETLEKAGKHFDLIFLDPPYGKEIIPQIFSLLVEGSVLRTSSIIVAETGVRDQLDSQYGDFVQVNSRRYGTTTIALFRLNSH